MTMGRALKDWVREGRSGEGPSVHSGLGGGEGLGSWGDHVWPDVDEPAEFVGDGTKAGASGFKRNGERRMVFYKLFHKYF